MDESIVRGILTDISNLYGSDSQSWIKLMNKLKEASLGTDIFTILSCFENHENAFLRATLAFYIQEHKDLRGYDVLLKYLDDADSGVQKIAAFGLGILGDQRALPKLERWRLMYNKTITPNRDYVSVADNAIYQIKNRKI